MSNNIEEWTGRNSEGIYTSTEKREEWKDTDKKKAVQVANANANDVTIL